MRGRSQRAKARPPAISASGNPTLGKVAYRAIESPSALPVACRKPYVSGSDSRRAIGRLIAIQVVSTTNMTPTPASASRRPPGPRARPVSATNTANNVASWRSSVTTAIGAPAAPDAGAAVVDDAQRQQHQLGGNRHDQQSQPPPEDSGV